MITFKVLNKDNIERMVKILDLIYYILFSFVVYSFLGWIIEEVYCFYKKHKFKEDGFLIGPFKPMYGIAVSILVIFKNYFHNNSIIILILCLLIPSIVEYISGDILQSIFNKKYWDYSNLKYNLNGLISIRFSIYWTFLTFFGLKYFEPFINNIYNSYNNIFYVIIPILLIYLLIDLYITINTLLNISVTKKHNNI